ncbi:ABC-2 transporter permease [Brevibacillus sp. B_LB10_24]|uniref:ABC-2 transporter permease n=1 Tax=Brevibacillus sp. B_LB10_24 TaxID=3380645 RepID=UPI0038BD4C6E
MFNLIVKDLLVMKKSILGIFFYIAVFPITFVNISGGFLTVGLFPLAIMLLNSTSNDLKNKNYILLGSLPIRRTQIVAAKYLGALFYSLAGVVIAVVTSMIFHQLVPDAQVAWMSVGQAVMLLSLALIFSSLYLPIFYWISNQGEQVANIVMTILLMITLVISFQLTVYTGKLFMLLAAIVLFLLSYVAAARIFSRKDF